MPGRVRLSHEDKRVVLRPSLRHAQRLRREFFRSGTRNPSSALKPTAIMLAAAPPPEGKRIEPVTSGLGRRAARQRSASAKLAAARLARSRRLLTSTIRAARSAVSGSRSNRASAARVSGESGRDASEISGLAPRPANSASTRRRACGVLAQPATTAAATNGNIRSASFRQGNARATKGDFMVPRTSPPAIPASRRRLHDNTVIRP